MLNICIFEPFDYERIAKHFLNLEIFTCSYVQNYFFYSNILISASIKIWYSACNKPKRLSKNIKFSKFMQPPSKNDKVLCFLFYTTKTSIFIWISNISKHKKSVLRWIVDNSIFRKILLWNFDSSNCEINVQRPNQWSFNGIAEFIKWNMCI